MNIIFRRCLGMLNLTEIRRDIYDSEAVQTIQVLLTWILLLSLTSYLFSFRWQQHNLRILDVDSPARRTAVAQRGDYFQSVARGHGFGCHGQNSPAGWRFQSKKRLYLKYPTLNSLICNVTAGLHSRVGRQGGDDGLQQTYLPDWRYWFWQNPKTKLNPGKENRDVTYTD